MDADPRAKVLSARVIKAEIPALVAAVAYHALTNARVIVVLDAAPDVRIHAHKGVPAVALENVLRNARIPVEETVEITAAAV